MRTITVYMETGEDDVAIVNVRGASDATEAEKAARAFFAGETIGDVTTDLRYFLARHFDGVDEYNIAAKSTKKSKKPAAA